MVRGQQPPGFSFAPLRTPLIADSSAWVRTSRFFAAVGVSGDGGFGTPAVVAREARSAMCSLRSAHARRVRSGKSHPQTVACQALLGVTVEDLHEPAAVLVAELTGDI